MSNFRELKWERYGRFWYDRMLAIYTIPDGSCLFHAVLNSFYKPYVESRLGTTHSNFVKKTLRPELANLLEQKVALRPGEDEHKTLYQQLANGNYEGLGISSYSLSGLQRELLGGGAVEGDCFFELLIKYLQRNIYVLSEIEKDVCQTASIAKNIEIVNAPCTVILHLPGHYELIGLRTDDGSVITNFAYNHPFIEAIRNRAQRMIKDGSKRKERQSSLPDLP